MGAGHSSHSLELSDDSSDSDFDYSLEPRPDKKQSNTLQRNLVQNLLSEPITNNLETDFINLELMTTDASSGNFPKPDVVLNLDGVFEIEKNLDDYEMVSLVYLLYEDANFALQELILYLEGAQKSPLYSWANLAESRSSPWQKKLVEALCVIKNYQTLCKLGYKKDNLMSYFLPNQPNAITTLNKVKKALYLICEKLNRTKTEKFLGIVKSHFEEKGMTFSVYDSEFLELYLLKWETLGYVSVTDVHNIRRALKIMEEEALINILDSVFPAPQEKIESKPTVNVEQTVSEKKTSKSRVLSTSMDTHQKASTSKAALSGDFLFSLPSLGRDNRLNFDEPHIDSNKYDIDPENPGLLLIINQEIFYTEIDDKFKDLLPADIESNKLESRIGTEKDKEDLISTFKKFGFRIVIEENLSHEELIVHVRRTVKSIRNESSLFVCILSHGDEGVVYGVNSCKVKVSEIQEIMCKTNKDHLLGKPKILILQSCQGKQCQKINEKEEEEEEEDYESNSITTDGPNNNKQSVPQILDMFTFWATVPGYAAIRNKKTGSWFIQALVKKMTELGNRHHFEDICTRIINDVSGKTWIVDDDVINAMTPMKMSTLRKDFYLPPMQRN